VVSVNVSEFEVKLLLSVPPLRLPETSVKPVIVVLKPDRVTVKLPGPAPAVLPKNW
jgi:hypothetical protein